MNESIGKQENLEFLSKINVERKLFYVKTNNIRS